MYAVAAYCCLVFDLSEARTVILTPRFTKVKRLFFHQTSFRVHRNVLTSRCQLSDVAEEHHVTRPSRLSRTRTCALICQGTAGRNRSLGCFGADVSKCLDAGSMQDGFQLMLWSCNGLPQQQWGYDASASRVYLANTAVCRI